jgi:beta-galactosidase
MRYIPEYLGLLAVLMIQPVSGRNTTADAHSGAPSRIVLQLNAGWLFAPGTPENAEAIAADESAFRPVCLPHTVVPVPHESIDTSSFAMLSWYRKHFTLPSAVFGKRIRIAFEGVSKAATVYCNGNIAGEYRGAYTPFTCDITDLVRPTGDNVLAVKVDSRQRTDIPPEGKDVDYMLFGGIVRDVALVATDPLAIDRVYACTDSTRNGTVVVTVRVINTDTIQRSGMLNCTLVDSTGISVATATWPVSAFPGAAKEYETVLGPVFRPHWWHPDHPYLYSIVTGITNAGKTVDSCSERFGMRTIAFGKKDGVFRLNGMPLRLRGLNRHETFPFIGRAAANRLQRRDAEILKFSLGCNVVRCSHYPQDPAFLDRCDEIGLLVLEEMAGWNWVSRKKEWLAAAYDNLTAMVLRDRNRPSVISFGVRINQSADIPEFYRETNRIARTLDPGRPTHGVRVLDRGSKWEFLEDVWAQNFKVPVDTPPVLPWITTESIGHYCPTHSYDADKRLLKQLLMHAAVQDSAAANPMIAGILGWCAFDYNSPHRYAENSVNYHGVADLFRELKPAGYFFRSQADVATRGPMVYIAHSWCAPLEPNDVWVVSNCDSVELFINGQSQGGKTPEIFRSLPHPLFVWRGVPFTPGEISATGYSGTVAVATDTHKTPGKPETLRIAADDAMITSGGDMTRVLITVVDKGAQVVPRAENPVTITVTGPADFYGESPVALKNGRMAFFLKTRSSETGTVVCSVRGKGLRPAETMVSVVDGGDHPAWAGCR